MKFSGVGNRDQAQKKRCLQAALENHVVFYYDYCMIVNTLIRKSSCHPLDNLLQ